ncbi:hypothetical protein E4U51_000533 [Claviceps purpurea]|nr:hypothetical protein E4U51_000533 [Claviceps purpurea]
MADSSPSITQDHNDLTKPWFSRLAIISPLKGAENFEEWQISIEMQVRIMELTPHLTGAVPHSTATDKYHAVITSVIWQSLSFRVQRNLIHAGWLATMPVTRMMTLIKNDCGFEADLAVIELLQQFSTSCRSNFATTRAWLDHHQNLWSRINKIVTMPEVVWISQTIKAVEDSMPEVHSSWKIKGFSKDLLTKEDMLTYLTYEANKPEKEQKLTFNTQSKAKSPEEPSAAEKNTTSQDVTLDCGCVIKPGRPTHNSDDCWTLYPDQKPEHLRMKTGPQSYASPDIVTAGLNFSLMTVSSDTMIGYSSPTDCLTRDDCILDSGCSTHTFNSVKWFTSLNTDANAKPMMASNGQRLKVTGVGTVRLPVGDGFLDLLDAHYAPQAEVNMISPGLLKRGGVIMDGHKDLLLSTGNGLPIGKFIWKSNISMLVLRDEQPRSNMAAHISGSITGRRMESGLLHKRRKRRPILLFTNSQNAKANVPRKKRNGRTRHVYSRHKCIKDKTTQGHFRLDRIATDQVIADGATNSLGRPRPADFIFRLLHGMKARDFDSAD